MVRSFFAIASFKCSTRGARSFELLESSWALLLRIEMVCAGTF